MKEIAEELGYEFRYKGCICEGSPLHYRKVICGHSHKLMLYQGRGIFRLLKDNYVVLHGDKSNIKTLLTEYEAKFDQSNQGAS